MNLSLKHLRVLVIFLLLGLTSCEQIILGPDPKNTPMHNFEFLWQEVKEKYAFFDLKEINWDNIYSIYQPKITGDMTDEQLFAVLSDMLNELRDGHVNLISDFDRSRHWDWFLDYPANFNRELVNRHYLGRDFLQTGPLFNQMIDSVLYVYYESFSQPILETHLQALRQRMAKAKGVIIDVRNNSGGNLRNAYNLSSILTSQNYSFARERTKNGPRAKDFSPWRDLNVTAASNNEFSGQIILLTNRACFSATSFFAQMVKALPKGIVLGDSTGGGGGLPVSGQLPNGWIFRLSVTQTDDLNGQSIELGVAPDMRMDMSVEDELQNKDTFIEAALDLLK